MPKRREGELNIGLSLLTEYARLYPSIVERMRKVLASSDPFVAGRVNAVARAAEVADRTRSAHLIEQFGLTPSEAKVALFVADGGSVKEYAALTQTSESTARVHLKAVFAKTGVHRQAELVRLIRN